MNTLDNRSILYSEKVGLNLRLRQVGIDVLRASAADKVAICVDPEKTKANALHFFLREKGKPNRRAAAIKKYVDLAAAKYGDKVKVDKGVVTLPKEEKTKESTDNTEK